MHRILFVYHVSTVGGGSYCLLNLLKVINRSVFEPIVMLPQKGPLCDEITKLGIEIVYYPSLALYPYNKTLLNFKTIKRLWKVNKGCKGFSTVLKTIHPEIVYFNSMMLFPYLGIAKECGVKTVLHIREHWPLEEHKFQLGRARKIVYESADKLIAINRYSSSIFPEKESTIVYDWIDMEARRGGPKVESFLHKDTTPKKIYLFTGGMQKIKGTIDVLQVFSDSIKGDDRRLIALGVESKLEWRGLKGQLKRILYRLGYKTFSAKVVKLCEKDERIICAPAIYDITDLMEGVDGLISFFTIPHANLALAESIILQLPAIAAKSDEALEYSDEGNLALLFKLGDKSAFRDAWMKLDTGDCELNNKLAIESVRVAEKFNPKRNSETFNKVLSELL